MAKQVAKRETAVVVTQRMRDAAAIEFPPLPEALAGKIDPKMWLGSMLGICEYEEPDDGYIAREMLMNILLTEDDEKALVGDDMNGLQDILEDYAMNTTGPIRITDIYVAKSDDDKGGGTYLILSWVSMETGEFTRTTTGASSVQMAFLRYLAKDVWPIECQIVRDKATDQGGKHILKVWPVDVT